jgi:hypothetical protein
MNARLELERLNWNLAGIWSAEALDAVSKNPAYRRVHAHPAGRPWLIVSLWLLVVAVLAISAWKS